MYRLSSGVPKAHFASAIMLLLLASVVGLSIGGSSPQSARDFEECVEQVEANLPPNNERGASLMDCNARFAARRKHGGGYTYYDFMQWRSFEIAGPNPTAEERKQIDGAYMDFLDAQRREAVSAERAVRHNEQLRADVEIARQAVGPPMVLTPLTSPPTATKRSIARSKSTNCEDGSLSCSWAKFSAAVRDALASAPKTNP
jgi:hypothetical protein